MDLELIAKTEVFLKETFWGSEALERDPVGRSYRLEHSYRVANIAKHIAEAENFNVTYAVIAGLLHDIGYCEEIVTHADRMNHGRRGAEIVRPFLESLNLPPETVNEICYGIAIHVDDIPSFEGERTPFAETVADADNIDRFDAYRIFETLHWQKFDELPLAEKKSLVLATLEKLKQFKENKLGTRTAQKIWSQRLDFYIDFYQRLNAQLNNSSSIL